MDRDIKINILTIGIEFLLIQSDICRNNYEMECLTTKGVFKLSN